MTYKVSNTDIITKSGDTVTVTARNVYYSGLIQKPLQGTVAGYHSGGRTPGSSISSTIYTYPFASDGNATTYGNLSSAERASIGQSSTVNGYKSGGGPPATSIIDKFPFAATGSATNIASLTQGTSDGTGSSSSVNGYTAGGGGPGVGVNTTVLSRFPFAADANATAAASLVTAKAQCAGQSSTTHGYVSGGNSDQAIQKYTFASDSNSTAVGTLASGRQLCAGSQSSVSGYTGFGGDDDDDTVSVNAVIDKFPFAADANATDVANLSVNRYDLSATSSTVSSYSAGGLVGPADTTLSNVIDKFPFAADGTATDVGDLPANRHSSSGQQY